MALPQYNNEELIANTKRRCAVPTSQLTYTPNDIVLIATDVLQDEVVPLIMSTRSEYFVEHLDVSTPANRRIAFPENAVGAKLRSVCYYQDTSPLTLINIPRIDLDVVAGVGYVNYNNFSGFFIEGNDIVLYPETSVPVGTVMRLYYYRRTLTLANPSAYGQVQSVNSGTNEIVLDFVPADWEVGSILNSVSSTANFAITNEAATITALSAPTITLDSVEGISVNDYVSFQGFSAIPQVPVEAHGYLAQLTAVKLLEGLGDSEGMKLAQEKADLLKNNLLVMISNRVDGSGKKVINPDGGLRVGSGVWRRGYSNW